jgi:hypothetical protein
MAALTDVLREERLTVWDRLLRGEAVQVAQVRELVVRLAHDAPDDERAATVLLLAAVKLSSRGTSTSRRKLLAVLRYFFSQVGTADLSSASDATAVIDGGLLEIMGRKLSWPQAIRSVAGNERDYKALTRTKDLLRRECRVEWQSLFGSTPPVGLGKGR